MGIFKLSILGIFVSLSLYAAEDKTIGQRVGEEVDASIDDILDGFDEAISPLDDQTILSTLKDYGFDAPSAGRVLASLKSKVPNSTPIVKGILVAHGLNSAFVFDRDRWVFDATIKTKEGSVARIPDLIVGDLSSPGVVAGVSYQYVLLFVTGVHSLSEMEQTTCGGKGKSLAGGLTGGVGAELGFLSCENSEMAVYLFAPKVGAEVRVSFPKITFSRNL